MTTEPTDISADTSERDRPVIDEASVLGRNKGILLAALMKGGANAATATYVGSGDSGSVEDVSVEMPTDIPFDLAALITVFAERSVFEDGRWHTSIIEQEESVEQALLDFADAAVDLVHGGWENNDGGSGRVIFDSQGGTVRIEHTAYYTDSDYEETTL